MAKPAPGEAWIVDLGMAAKVRPCLILSDYPTTEELALIVIVPHTTAVRGNRWEFVLSKPFLKPGAFHLQQIQPVSLSRFERRVGALRSLANSARDWRSYLTSRRIRRAKSSYRLRPAVIGTDEGA